MHIPVLGCSLKLGLLLPVAALFGRLAYTHYEIHREYSLRIVAESTEQAHALKLGGAYTTQSGTHLIG